MSEQIAAALQMIEDATYGWVVGVKYGAYFENLDRGEAARNRANFSTDDANCAKQQGHLWSRAGKAFRERGLEFAPRDLPSEMVLHFKRRAHIVRYHRDLIPRVEVIDRLRPGLNEAVLQSRLGATSTHKAGPLTEEVVLALTGYDLPHVVELAEQDQSLKDGLEILMGFTIWEWERIQTIDGELWRSLAECGERCGQAR